MAQKAALICRLLASSVSISHKAGKIIRDVMQKGDLGIIDKVKLICIQFFFLSFFSLKIITFLIF